MPEKPKLLLFTTPEGWGPISEQQRDEYMKQLTFFRCGHCSNEDADVFHNTWGSHVHRSAAELIRLMPKEDKETNV